MASTSGTYNFYSIEVELIIREAFERIGISGETIESRQLESAKRSIDFMMLDWMNRKINLWTLQYEYLPLITGKTQYVLPTYVNNINQVKLVRSTRNLEGTPASTGAGDAANAFDGNEATACTQNAADGNISYDYGLLVTQQITLVGIKSDVNRNYTINIEYSQDQVNWFSLLVLENQIFTAGTTKWFNIPAPLFARSYRIRESGGSTLAIREIYFNNNISNSPITEVSRSDYFSLSNNGFQSSPSSYFLDRGITKIFNIWPAPSSEYNCLMYSYERSVQDVGGLYTNTVQVPPQFYPALVAGLAYNLAVKYKSQEVPIKKAEYDEAFELAKQSNAEQSSLTISLNYNLNL